METTELAEAAEAEVVKAKEVTGAEAAEKAKAAESTGAAAAEVEEEEVKEFVKAAAEVAG